MVMHLNVIVFVLSKIFISPSLSCWVVQRLEFGCENTHRCLKKKLHKSHRSMQLEFNWENTLRCLKKKKKKSQVYWVLQLFLLVLVQFSPPNSLLLRVEYLFSALAELFSAGNPSFLLVPEFVKRSCEKFCRTSLAPS